MEENTFTIQEALNKLKTLDKRIKNFNSQLLTVVDVREQVPGFNNKKEFVEYSKSEYNSIKDLINFRNKLKSAVIKSNAETYIEPLGMTVAEAIERKQSIDYDKILLSELKRQLRDAENFHKEKTFKLDDETAKMFQIQLVDPVNIRDEIKKLEKKIQNFEDQVDTELTKSNVVTTIKVE